MNPKINLLNSNLTKYREEIVNHPLYKKLNSVEDIAVMMEHHVYAVWDFMSLLKALQSLLTCTTSPWKPVGDGKIRQLVNSIVLEEESDVDKENNPLSHYEMYIDAMKQCGANTSAIENFVSNVSATNIPSVNVGVDAFLKRIRIMNIKLDIPVGEYRDFTKSELNQINQLVKNSSKTIKE